ncbi:hypothetical protein K488DRAFT_76427 [Vararia minispora EC-137]|uniref:Uncharacterized protein n=1 Tax=Vararia minispora EC-137 TaxID=1314806 RepID=A0ACB8QW29_9AGAM|nr:hypothetical protein K488DRAFT_76427 [Vararia minispora EC-137]
MHCSAKPALDVFGGRIYARAASNAANPAPPSVRVSGPSRPSLAVSSTPSSPGPSSGLSKWAVKPPPSTSSSPKSAQRPVQTSNARTSVDMQPQTPHLVAAQSINSPRHRAERSSTGVQSTLQKQLSESAQRGQEAQQATKERYEQTRTEEDFEQFDDNDPTGPSRRRTNRKQAKLLFKGRRSLLDADAKAGVPQRHGRASDNPTPIKKVKVPKAGRTRKVRVDLHIPNRLQRTMRRQGMEEQSSPDHILTTEWAALLAEEFGRSTVVDDEAAFDIYAPPPASDPSTLPQRPPVVTIMGHVDHGKTTLLDTLRSASVAAGEAGGITQHIGAFSVPVPGNGNNGGPPVITFLDTPGHAAFSAMRARGARVTDIVVLVVAADDGVMPQTKEVIELVKKDNNVQLIVAINKIDKPGVDLEHVRNALLVEDIHVESIGGDVPDVQVSGLTGKGLDNLIETISTVSELQDLRAERIGLFHGYVLESRVQKGLGPVATVLVLRGCLRPAAYVIAGFTSARVRVMTDSNGRTVKTAHPGDAVTVSGWKELPAAGDEVLQGSDSDIKKALANRARKADLEKMLEDIEVINEQRAKDREIRAAELLAEENGEEPPREIKKEGGPKELRLLIKGDVSGSVEALNGVLQNIGNDVACSRVIDSDVGEVSSSDVLRAKTADAMIVAFSVPVPKPVQVDANSKGVIIYTSSIIYQVIDEIRARVTDLLPQQYGKKVTGEATVLEIFDIHLRAKQTKKVAGCRITNGVVQRGKNVQVVRNGEVIFEGRMDTFKHRKDDIMEAKKNTECGIAIEGFTDLKPDDLIQAYDLYSLPKFLT